MPRFYFHLRNHVSVDDTEGKELADARTALAQARRYATDMASVSIVEQGRINLRHRIEVADEAGETIAVVKFGDVVTIED